MLKNFPKLPCLVGVNLILAITYLFYSLPSDAQESPPAKAGVLSQTQATLLQEHFLKQLETASKNISAEIDINLPPASFSFYPVTTTALTPGENLNEQQVYPNLLQSIFLIGSDANSQQWLRDHQVQLQKLKALGLVVSVPNEAALQDLRNEAPALTLLPVNGSAIAQQFGLSHYPVLLMSAKNPN